jgi:putative transposase
MKSTIYRQPNNGNFEASKQRAPTPELCREHGMNNSSFYKWRTKYGDMDASLMTRMEGLEDENRRLRKMYSEERLKAEVIQEAIAKKW